jgi:thiol-disulfide isomerase/thioredoxin
MATKMTTLLRLSSAVLTLVLVCSAAVQPALAQPPKSTAAVVQPVVQGMTLDKKKFQLAALKGKVVMLMFWSTDCPVCRDKMPELRRNVQGWVDKPFELVLVSTDLKMADVDGYNAILNKSVPMNQRFTQLWSGEPGYKDNLNLTKTSAGQLPLTYILGKDGKVLHRIQGRIPANMWDDIAELL